jgi:long-subunit fatty acid transport protein
VKFVDKLLIQSHSKTNETMRFLILQLLFYTLFLGKTTAQIGYRLVSGGQSAAMNNAVLAMSTPDAVFQNPAALIYTTRPTATVATEMRFGVKELRPVGVGVIQPTKSGVFGCFIQHFGFSAFQQQKIGLAFAKRFSERMTLGVQLDYLHLQASGYGNANILTFELGCNTLITKELTLAFYVFNPLAVRLSESERTPSVFRLGAAYSVNKNIVITAEIEKSIVDATNFRMGFDYKVAETLAVRCGFSSLPASFSIGIGYFLSKNCVIDAALSHQSALGSTPSVSVTYAFGKEKSEMR